ncbi:hypothetical protein M9H77_06077 [Catharanthus roseus]|uniref:Uncharacterized protein n=1 Tax=Catharanthus roseus TaxID=4058 RepID=A0ACC0BR42_CATRO|nr:hypothetical protein M9H77_06077 [Catharanthus roseus]
MVTQHGIKLATYLVSTQWGAQNSKVLECLLRRGTLTLAQIVRFTELSRENVRQSLLVLIHQNCIQAFAIQREGGFGEAPKVITEYMPLFDNVIHIMRFPKFIQIVSEELGKECEEIFEGLLQHGRLPLGEIIDRHKQTSTQGNCSTDAVLETFNKLVNARFVERCPAPEPFLEPPAEDETPAKKRGAKTAKVSELPKTIEQRALAAAAPLDSVRFLVEIDNGSDIPEKANEEHPNDGKVGEKRKHGSLKSDGGLMGNHEKKEILWRANFEEFMRRLRHKACIANVRSRLGDDSRIVLSAVLELSRRSETKVKTESTASLSLDDIYDEVIKNEGGLGMNLERIRAALVQLGCEMPMIQIDETYSIDLKNIIDACQNEEVESIVLKRYGREAHRIFRLLSKAGHLLESHKIADATFVDKKDAIKILYKLWKDDYLQMEKVTIGGARQQFFLWKVNKGTLHEHVLDEMYHAALNLRLRIQHEQEQGKEILLVPREKLVGELGKKFKRLRKVRIILESCLMNLDDALMLFHDF